MIAGVLFFFFQGGGVAGKVFGGCWKGPRARRVLGVCLEGAGRGMRGRWGGGGVLEGFESGFDGRAEPVGRPGKLNGAPGGFAFQRAMRAMHTRVAKTRAGAQPSAPHPSPTAHGWWRS